ncbi:TlpA family protein disulfide reductase [Marinoscillum pacificum]|uniref:TlpA family protein disulfide reductase n=1 Tax=Marinoscillum pacificum TaxID=392723 RepID=UPI0021588029|nr:TlpA disulfide reductase family protein [Marinoscillum pacificum]
MKNLAILIVSIFFIISCADKVEEQKMVSISGTITNPKGETITFTHGELQVVDTLNELGAFTSKIDLTKAGRIRFKHGDEIGYLYAHPGDEISFTLDTDLFDETLVFQGDAADVNNYLASMTLLNDSLLSFQDLMILEEDDFIRTQDSINNLKISYLKDLLDKEFVEETKENLYWDTYTDRLDYEGSHEYYLQIPMEDFNVSEGFYSFITELNIGDSSKLENKSFKRYVRGLVRYVSSEIRQSDNSISYYEGYSQAVDSVVSLKPLKIELIQEVIIQSYAYLSEDFRSELIEKWKSWNPDTEKLSEISELVASWNKLAKGKPAPDFAYESIDGDTLSIEDFRGSVVYIDVWATWCGPCIGEHPAMEKLQERFKDQNVTFLAVSIDSTKEPWEKMVVAKKLGGVHVFAPGAWDAQIMKDYLIKGIPRFVLIDQEGYIVDATAQRPSGNIAKDIEALLNPV